MTFRIYLTTFLFSVLGYMDLVGRCYRWGRGLCTLGDLGVLSWHSSAEARREGLEDFRAAL